MKFKNINFILVVLFFLGCCSNKDEIIIHGKTMGTFYSVEINNIPKEYNNEFLKIEIEKTLVKVNKILSNWDENSEISLLNDNKSSLPIKLSKQLFETLEIANYINKKSKGYYDVTIDPIIELWGFGYKNKNEFKIPNNKKIQNVLKFVNQNKFLKLNKKTNEITKLNPNLRINLSSIGKGYGIDMIAKKIESLGISNYLINIGGDIFARGKNRNRKKWKIGIENPDLKDKMIKEVVSITDKGVATSGDYKNYFTKNKVRFSHLLNPKTGKPIKHKTKSVTVITNSATLADGFATAFLVMGRIKGIEISEKLNIPVLFIDEIKGNFVKFKNKNFEKLSKE